MYQKTTLDNGLRILTSAMPHTRSASIILYYGVGQRYEPQEITGISHFIEHMLFKGTQRRPTPQEISEDIEGLGFTGTGEGMAAYAVTLLVREQ